ncbi:DUF1667 domain-containing protein [Spirochaeta isovalerica]|uniref:CxxC motif-containing protein n=1 Tax=Spirochaeta isovalerica TaxID=150 RepID=A0A841R967_9SPIO|nr:DUF1667 domain-containing protein [Spirochaeta isovalerica]MBB6480443.1 CxxC motif-containing protein [Spirochaeta isovalerica]
MKSMTCIVCPKGCSLSIEEKEKGFRVSGALCPRGEEYALQEMTDPRRTLQTTIRTNLPGCRRVAVRTSKEVPLGEIFSYMDAIKGVILEEKKECGSVLARGLCDSDVDLILTERLY